MYTENSSESSNDDRRLLLILQAAFDKAITQHIKTVQVYNVSLLPLQSQYFSSSHSLLPAERVIYVNVSLSWCCHAHNKKYKTEFRTLTMQNNGSSKQRKLWKKKSAGKEESDLSECFCLIHSQLPSKNAFLQNFKMRCSRFSLCKILFSYLPCRLPRAGRGETVWIHITVSIRPAEREEIPTSPPNTCSSRRDCLLFKHSASKNALCLLQSKIPQGVNSKVKMWFLALDTVSRRAFTSWSSLTSDLL